MLLGAQINGFAKRGREVSPRKLRAVAKRMGKATATVDYRNLGYVTEVKDQVAYCLLRLFIYFALPRRRIAFEIYKTIIDL